MDKPVWWAVACSEELNEKKPIGVHIGDQPVVLWRDAEGQARALEDRCPHRRAPLSLGCVLDSGAIQCGYHGWTYAPDSGRLIDIPNLKSDRKFPPIYRAKTFGVQESGGFVRVCLDPKAIAPALGGDVLPDSGVETIALDHRNYVDALLDDPSLVIGIRGVRFTTYLFEEVKEKDGRLMLERSCQWSSNKWPASFSAEFPLAAVFSVEPETGQCDILLRDSEMAPILRISLAPVPAARGTTQVRWRAKKEDGLSGIRGKILGVGTPLTVRSHVDAEKLRMLRPSVSDRAAQLRDEMTGAPAPENADAAA